MNRQMTLKEALQIIEGGGWFGVRYLTADDRRGTGGEVIDIKRAKIARKQPAASRQLTIEKNNILTAKKRDANHNYNFTRNIELPNRMIRTIHPILITHLNGIALV